jgi:hypothetical protein
VLSRIGVQKYTTADQKTQIEAAKSRIKPVVRNVRRQEPGR